MQAVYVESDYNHVMDVADLEKKLEANPDCNHVLVSHMRGKVGDMDAILKACEKHDAILLEDCAHSLGVEWQGKHTGHVGKVCGISSQSYKMINSGEGGFLLTDDPDVAARCAVYAGAYEGLAAKHMTVPGPEHERCADASRAIFPACCCGAGARLQEPEEALVGDRVVRCA